MTNVAQAVSIVSRVAPDLPRFGVAFVVAIAGIESSLGQGFLPHNNWGAETAAAGWSGATFDHEDKRWTPSGVVSYVTQFRDYESQDAAAAGLVSLLRNQYGAALAAAEQGHWYDASRLLYKSGYYKGTKPPDAAIADHFKAMSVWLIKQGINPALVGGALLLEAAFWTGLAMFTLTAVRKAKR